MPSTLPKGADAAAINQAVEAAKRQASTPSVPVSTHEYHASTPSVPTSTMPIPAAINQAVEAAKRAVDRYNHRWNHRYNHHRYNHRWNHRYNHTDEANGQRGDLSAHPVPTVRVLTLQVARMASGQASHTPVLTAAGAPNVALGLQVQSYPEYPREYSRVPS